MTELHLNTLILLNITAGKHLLVFVRPLSDKQTINFSNITLSAKEPSEYHMEN